MANNMMESSITLFKEQVNNEIANISEQHSLESPGQGFIWWYFMRLHGMNAVQVQEIFSDGGGDLGIDAIYKDPSERVHFYQFKNLQKIVKEFPTEDVDKVISGLHLIIGRQYRAVANPALRERIQDTLSSVPSGYVLHLISSGAGITHEAKVKLDNFIASLGASSGFSYEVHDLKRLQHDVFTRTLPTVEKKLTFDLTRQPYVLKAGDHESYMFHLPGKVLAELYAEVGELLLQQNIRIFEGFQGANRSMYETGTTKESVHFYHYNNGVAFLCDEAKYDIVTSTMTLTRAQVVNGGQTIRVLAWANADSKLNQDVAVPVRVITAAGDKEFASNVAVNLNKQTKVESSFLRSNDPFVVQLDNAIASAGWYLERREDEAAGFTDADKNQIARRIGRPFSEELIIPLKEGAQAYTATYFGHPDLAKKDPQFIFKDAEDGGYFSRIFGPGITAEKFINAYRLYQRVNLLVDNYKRLKRRKSRLDNWKTGYQELLGGGLVEDHADELDQVIPQSVMFLCGLLYQRHVVQLGAGIDELVELVQVDRPSVATHMIEALVTFAHEYPAASSKSWPTLLKSQSFFNQLLAYLKGESVEDIE